MLVGRITKDSADRRRIIVDFGALNWLDDNEVLAGFTVPVVTVEPAQVSWSPPQTAPPPPIPDTTPLVITNDAALSADKSQVVIFAEDGTPQLTYRVIFTVTASKSTRVKQVDVLVYVRE